MQIFIETERLLLREILPTDDQAMFELDADPQVHTYLGRKPVKSIEESQDIISFIRDQYTRNGIGRWAVIEKDTQAFVGWSGLKLITETINNHTNYYDLGYRFIRKYWGKGYATESASASLNYGFTTMRLQQIYAMAMSGNLSSQHVLQKVGLRFVEKFTYQEEQMYWYTISNPAI